jgi:nitrilase
MGKVAAVQMTSSHVVADNLTAAGELLRQAKDLGCDIACLPENFSFIGLRDADKVQVAEPDGEGVVQSFLSDTARKLKMWILGGTILIRSKTDRRVANASLLIDAAGKRVARYDKIHLFDVTIPAGTSNIASRRMSRGRETVIADTPVGNARTLGVLRHAISSSTVNSWRAAPVAGAAFTCRPAAPHWRLLYRARAINLYVMWWRGRPHPERPGTYGDSLSWIIGGCCRDWRGQRSVT